MRKAGWEKNFYLIEGFPKNQEGLDAWRNVLKEKIDTKMVLSYDGTIKIMEKRLLERGQVGSLTDDDFEGVKQRLAAYQEEVQPVVKQFEKEKLLKKINADKNIQTIFSDSQNALKSVKKFLRIPDPKPNVIFVLGAEGSGKKAQCERIIDEFKFVSLCVGDLLRGETNTDSPLCREIEGYIMQGQIVPVTINILN